MTRVEYKNPESVTTSKRGMVARRTIRPPGREAYLCQPDDGVHGDASARRGLLLLGEHHHRRTLTAAHRTLEVNRLASQRGSVCTSLEYQPTRSDRGRSARRRETRYVLRSAARRARRFRSDHRRSIVLQAPLRAIAGSHPASRARLRFQATSFPTSRRDWSSRQVPGPRRGVPRRQPREARRALPPPRARENVYRPFVRPVDAGLRRDAAGWGGPGARVR
jgi:hypothetical protein